MTVIFHSCIGTPVMAGDMLISVRGPNAHTDLKLPSQPSGIIVPPTELPNFVPIRMRRKIFIVNDHLAVGATGSVLHIVEFVDRIFKEFRDKPVFLAV